MLYRNKDYILKTILATTLSLFVCITVCFCYVPAAFATEVSIETDQKSIHANVILPAGIAVIEPELFSGDVSITSVTIPLSVTQIGNGAFSDCAGLTVVLFDGNALQWDSISIGEGNEPLMNSTLYFNDGQYRVPVNAINFPDENFRSYVSENFDVYEDGILSSDECNAVTEINVSEKNISDLSGLRYFPELARLICYGNQLTSLDVSHNTKLITLVCGESISDGSPYGIRYGNDITEIDVSNNPLLETLWCPFNRLTVLDVSHNPDLIQLGCMNNMITLLDTSFNTNLQRLLVGGNPLGTIDVSQNTELKQLNCYNNGLNSLDLSHNTKLTFLWCNDNDLTSLTLNNQPQLQNINCSGNQLTELLLSNNTFLQSLNCRSNWLTNLVLPNNASLQTLNCNENQLSSLDVTGCTGLKNLSCETNLINSLNVSNCTLLEQLHCYHNQLQSMDLSNNTALRRLNLSVNQISNLILGNAPNLEMLWLQNNQNKISSLDLSNFPILVDVYENGTLYDFGNSIGYMLGDGINPSLPRTQQHCQLSFDKVVEVTY